MNVSPRKQPSKQTERHETHRRGEILVNFRSPNEALGFFFLNWRLNMLGGLSLFRRGEGSRIFSSPFFSPLSPVKIRFEITESLKICEIQSLHLDIFNKDPFITCWYFITSMKRRLPGDNLNFKNTLFFYFLTFLVVTRLYFSVLIRLKRIGIAIRVLKKAV